MRAVFAAPVICALLASGASHAEGDRHDLYLGLSGSYRGVTTHLVEWPEGGLSKLRYTDDGLGGVKLFADYRARISPTVQARVIADYEDDADSGIDVTEAYIDWRPIPSSPNQHQLRVGAFYPPFSLENGERGWQSPFTYSFSAINTWLGEEIRPIGVEWQFRRRLANTHELRTFASGFYGNDPAATLLFWRGWSLHDRQTRLGDRLELPPAPIFGATGVTGLAPQSVRPFRETDHEPGFYAGLEWRYSRRVLVQLARYENRADPMSFAGAEWGWETDFNHLGVQVELPGAVGIVSQWMNGYTDWLAGGKPDGTIAPNAFRTKDEFGAWFLLVTRKWLDAHRVSLRYDSFSIENTEAGPPSIFDDGHAWTVSYRYEPKSRYSVGFEWLRIDSLREIWPFFYGAPLRASERQLRAELAFHFGTVADH